MRLIRLVLAVAMMISCYGGAVAQESSKAPRVGDLQRVAKAICSQIYGKPSPRDSQGLEYYCARLQNPMSWVQDQEWWKQNAPAFLQAAEPQRKPEDSLAMPWDQCVRNGGSYLECKECTSLLSSAQKQLDLEWRARCARLRGY